MALLPVLQLLTVRFVRALLMQYAGLSAGEWLAAVQALLLSIREAQGMS